MKPAQQDTASVPAEDALKTSNVVLIAGPGRADKAQPAFDDMDLKAEILAFERGGSTVIHTGDAENGTTLPKIRQALEIAKANGNPTTVFLVAHGDVADPKGPHYIKINEEKDGIVKSEDVFKTVANVFDRPVDFFPRQLPRRIRHQGCGHFAEGLDAGGAGAGSESVEAKDVNRLVLRLLQEPESRSEDFSARHLLNEYLTGPLQTRTAPVMAISGQGVYDPVSSFYMQLGQSFTEQQKKTAHAQLDGLMGPTRVSQTMDTITSTNDDNFIDTKDFGPALAVLLNTTTPLKPLDSYNAGERSFSFNRQFGSIAEISNAEKSKPPAPAR